MNEELKNSDDDFEHACDIFSVSSPEAVASALGRALEYYDLQWFIAREIEKF